jgi:hypothetical protein
MRSKAGPVAATSLMLLLCLVAAMAVRSRAPATSASPPIVSALDIMSGLEERRVVLLDALRVDPGGNLWHSASKGLVALYRSPSPAVQALIQLERAAGADPKCEDCCTAPAGSGCGEGAGYWSLPLLIRAYYMFAPDSAYKGGFFAGRLPAKLADQLKGYMRSYLARGGGKGYGNCGRAEEPRCTSESTLLSYDASPYAYISASDNHTVIQASAILLASQALREESAQVAELYGHWLEWWSGFLDALAHVGFWETASPTYVERHLAPLYNLYDFAEDPLIRRKAEMVIDWYWAEIAQELLHGVRGGPKMRVYWTADGDRGARSARNDTMYGVYYLYFGDSAFSEAPAAPNAEMYSAIFATSSYVPPHVVLELGSNAEARGSYEVKERRKGSCFVWNGQNTTEAPYNSRRYVHITPDYVLGTYQSDADKRFMPWSSQVPHLQDSLVFATSPEARISWGEWGLIGSGHLNTFQHENVVLVSRAYHPELSLAHHLPGAGVLDHVEEQNGWIFVQEGQAYAALRYVQNEVLIVEAARSSDFGGFESFKETVQRPQPGLSLSNIDAGFVEYLTAGGDVMWFPLADTAGTCRYTCNCSPSPDRLPKVNGKTVDWQSYALFDSPYVQSDWQSGVVEVVFAGKELILDFRDPENPIKTERVVVEPSPTPESTRPATPTVAPTPTQTAEPPPGRDGICGPFAELLRKVLTRIGALVPSS